MNDIVLYVQNESDFYKAWEQVFAEEQIDNYENTADGLKYEATSSTWIESLPDVLTFQMQRLLFEKGQMVKKNHMHQIPKTIYPDRFLH